MRNMIRVLALLLCAAHGPASAQDKAPAAPADKPLYKVVDGYKELRDYTNLGGSLTVFALPM